MGLNAFFSFTVVGEMGYSWQVALGAVIAAIMMPLSFSIANGIALGFISYTVIKVASGRTQDVSPSVYAPCALFVAKFIFF